MGVNYTQQHDKGGVVAGGPHPALTAEDLDAIERRMTARVVSVGAAYIALGVTMFLVLLDRPPGVRVVELLRPVFVLSVLLTAVVVPSAVYLARRDYAQRTAWIREQRQPSAGEVRRTALGAFWVAFLMLLAGVVFSGTFVIVGRIKYPWLDALRVEAGATVVVIGAALLGLLVAERTLGPILALTADRHRPPIGFVTRLVLVWAQAAAVPVTGLIMSPEKVNLDAVRWSVLGTGLIMSLGGFLVTGRNVAVPLRQLRRAVERVRTGDLDVQVQPDDGGELGQLQTAFNEMVDAMRQRDRLQVLFGQYVGEAVAQHALAGDGSLGGELCEVTALFVDIDGSTQLAETLPPDELVVMLNGFYGVVVEVVAAEGGLVNKFEGDAALAVFGAPVEDADHADRALRAARSLRERLAAMSIVFPKLDAGIGVATGAAVAGNVGAADRYEFTVIGDPVNVASRLSDMAQEHPGRVLVSETTIAASTTDFGNWVADGVAVVRGRSADTTLYVPASASSKVDNLS
jgi:adenylate cyclase